MTRPSADTRPASPSRPQPPSEARDGPASPPDAVGSELSAHAKPVEQVLSELRTAEHGLGSSEVAVRKERFGPNVLPRKPPPTLLEVSARQFKSPLIYVLAVAAVLSLAIGETTDAAFIALVLALNAVIGTYQEWKAEKSTLALQKLLQMHALVQRDGELRELSAEELVPGDVVWIESGNRVPADLRLLSAQSLSIDESLLTGESLAVSKDPAWLGDVEAPLVDRHNMVHAGSIVARGRGKGVVVATASGTAVGKLARDVMGAEGGMPPLIARMERFTRVIAVAVLVAAVAIGLLAIVVSGYTWMETFLFVVALAVSAIPEGLPVAMTVALAIATTRMAKRGVIVRRLAAVEGLGSCTLVATDKTGTLTVNEMTVRRVVVRPGECIDVTGEGFRPEGEALRDGKAVSADEVQRLGVLGDVAALCNEAELHRRDGEWVTRGDAVDIAMLVLGHKLGRPREAGLERWPLLDTIPYEPELRFAASFHRAEDGVAVFVKGSPERVLAMCDAMPEADRNAWKRQAEALARQGYRVLALARGSLDHLDTDSPPPEPSGLTMVGLGGMIDPLRAGVVESVADCGKAGVSVTMVTGDHPDTALAIARELGLATRADQVMTGADLAEASAQELADAVERVRVFARVAPDQKLQIVDAARGAGHFVAVTGDGVNDAPALKAANIGVAMGRSGTDVAREAAELVISDDNFATIVAGIEEGRIAYDNVRKVVYLLISTGAAELVLVTMSVLTGMPLPLLPVQILWLNLVTNGIQDVALAFEPGEGDVLERRPRSPRERLFNRLMIERTVLGALAIGVVGFQAFRWMMQAGWGESEARNALLFLMVLFENIHIGNCRSETKSAFALSPLRSPLLLGGTLTAFGVHVLAMHVPVIQSVLGTSPVPLEHFAVLALLALTVLPVMELHKWSWRWRSRAA